MIRWLHGQTQEQAILTAVAYARKHKVDQILTFVTTPSGVKVPLEITLTGDSVSVRVSRETRSKGLN